MRRIALSLSLLTCFACKSGPAEAPDEHLPVAAAHTATVAAANVDDEPWRANPPAPGPELSFQLPLPKQQALKNGLTVLVAEVHDLPLVSMVLTTRVGSFQDPKGKAGLAALSYGLLGEGTKSKDALAFTNAVADLGASFGVSAAQDNGLLAITGLSKNADAMLGLLTDAALRPRLDPKDFERNKSLKLAQITAQHGSPGGLAAEQLPTMIYGPDHPYGHPPGGVISTVKTISLADIKGFLDKNLAPGNSALIVAGDLSLEQAVKLAEKHLGSWNKKAPPEVSMPKAEAKPRTELRFIDVPGAKQTMIAVGRPLFGRGSPDETVMSVVNEVLGGGGLASRLNMNLREKNGYSYGAFSAVSPRHEVGAFYAMTQVRADATGPALAELMGELGRMDTMPPTLEELTRAKNGIIRGIPGQIEHLSTLATMAAEIFIYKLSPEYFSEMPKRVAAVNEDTAAKAAKSYLEPSAMGIVLVGDASARKAEVEALKLGAVVVEKPKD
ncbi:MAG: pitrilysin family protein [Myxococcota bacterium]